MTKKLVLVPPTRERRWGKEHLWNTGKKIVYGGLVIAAITNTAEYFRTVNNCTPTYTRTEIKVPDVVPQAPYETLTFLGAQLGCATCRDFERENQRDPRKDLFETDRRDYFRLF